MKRASLLLIPVLCGVARAAVMLTWSCNTCPYSTNVRTAKVQLEDGLDLAGSLAVRHIIGEKGSGSLEIRGPLKGAGSRLMEMRLHATGTCSSQGSGQAYLGDLIHKEVCYNCQEFLSMKVLESTRTLTLGDGGANDVAGTVITFYDPSKESMLACGKVILDPSP